MGTCQIVYNSIMLAMDKQEVIDGFARLFKLPPDKASAILARPKTVLRSNLDAATAEIYREKLVAIGLDVDVVDTSLVKPVPARAIDVVRATDVPVAQPLALAPLPEVAADAGEPVRLHGNRDLPFDFAGSGGEYCRIWLVNVLLTLLTLGVYSAWAKVRTQQYFYGNTSIDGASFRYLATPAQILKGRAIGLVLLLLYFGSQQFSLQAGLVALAALVIATPALLVLGMQARLGFTAWRNVRFGFERDFTGAYKLLALPLLVLAAVAALGRLLEQGGEPGSGISTGVGIAMLLFVLLLPYWIFAATRFLVEHARYGNAFFAFAARPLQYYLLFYVKAPLVFIGGMVLFFVGIALTGSDEVRAAFDAWKQFSLEGGLAGLPDGLLSYLLPLVFGALFVVGYLVAIAYLQASQFNLRYHGMSLGKSVLSCNVEAGRLLWLWLSNTLGIVLTAGLFIPWAKVRMVRYRLSCLTLHASYDLDDIVSEARRVDAVGQEVSDLFDIDIAL